MYIGVFKINSIQYIWSILQLNLYEFFFIFYRWNHISSISHTNSHVLVKLYNYCEFLKKQRRKLISNMKKTSKIWKISLHRYLLQYRTLWCKPNFRVILLFIEEINSPWLKIKSSNCNNILYLGKISKF